MNMTDLRGIAGVFDSEERAAMEFNKCAIQYGRPDIVNQVVNNTGSSHSFFSSTASSTHDPYSPTTTTSESLNHLLGGGSSSMVQTFVEVGRLCRMIQYKYEDFPRIASLANGSNLMSLEKIHEMIEYHSSVQTLLEQLHQQSVSVMTIIPSQPQLLQLLDKPLPAHPSSFSTD